MSTLEERSRQYEWLWLKPRSDIYLIEVQSEYLKTRGYIIQPDPGISEFDDELHDHVVKNMIEAGVKVVTHDELLRIQQVYWTDPSFGHPTTIRYYEHLWTTGKKTSRLLEIRENNDDILGYFILDNDMMIRVWNDEVYQLVLEQMKKVNAIIISPADVIEEWQRRDQDNTIRRRNKSQIGLPERPKILADAQDERLHSYEWLWTELSADVQLVGQKTSSPDKFVYKIIIEDLYVFKIEDEDIFERVVSNMLQAGIHPVEGEPFLTPEEYELKYTLEHRQSLWGADREKSRLLKIDGYPNLMVINKIGVMIHFEYDGTYQSVIQHMQDAGVKIVSPTDLISEWQQMAREDISKRQLSRSQLE